MGVLANANDEKLNIKNEKTTPETSLLSAKLDEENLAPDGGWGWIVAAGMAISQVMTISQTSAAGLIFGDFMEATGHAGSAFMLLNLVFVFSFSITGLCCNALLKKYSPQFVGAVGAAIYAIAYMSTCVAPNISYMASAFFVQGFGIGVIMAISTTSVNSYFLKRRALVTNLIQSVVGVGGIIYPIIVEIFLRKYGFRGCVAVVGALSCNAIPCMLTMVPVERHWKKSKRPQQTENLNDDKYAIVKSSHDDILLGSKEIEQRRRHSMGAVHGWNKNMSVTSLRHETEHENPLLVHALKASHRSHNPSDACLDLETRPRKRQGRGSNLDLMSQKISLMSATSVSSITGIGAFTDLKRQHVDVESKNANGKKKSLGSILRDFFELSLLKDRVYVNMCIGMSVTVMSDITFTSFLPMIMADQEYTTSQIALTLTTCAFAELVSRISLVVYAILFNTKAKHLFLTAAYLLFAAKIAFLYCNSLTSTIIVNAIIGVARAWYQVPQPLVLAEHFEIEKFPAAWGLFTVINGCVSLIICPTIGIIKDWTGSYLITQYVLTGMLLLCLVPWTIEYFVLEVFPRRRTTEVPSQQ